MIAFAANRLVARDAQNDANENSRFIIAHDKLVSSGIKMKRSE
jgi:hypothetical protein